MKNTLLKITAGILVFFGVSANAQITTNGNTASALTNTNLFMDASKFEELPNSSWGKALGFPRTNLTTYTFTTDPMDNLVINSDFDGIVVYNSATGNTLAGQGAVTAVTPGFYYFSNPGNPGNITNGRWLPLGGAPTSPKFDVTTAAAGTATNTLVAGAQVYAIKGQFTTTGTSTAVTITPPTGITSMYGITIYKKAGVGTGNGNKVVYARDLYSYDTATGAAVTGSQSMSVVYPQDTYEYILEYLK